MTGPRRPVGAVLKLLAAALLLGLVARHIDWRASAAILGHVAPGWFAVALALNLVGVVLSCLRWRLALAQLTDGPPALGTLLRLYLIGNFVNLGLPGMAGGDVVRAEMMRRVVGRRNLAYGSILTDRLIGVLAVVVVAALAGIGAHRWLDATTEGLIAVASLGVAGLLGALVLALRSAAAERLLPARLAVVLAPMRVLARRPAILAASLGIAVVVQGACAVLPVALLARAMGIDVPFAVHFALIPVAILTALIPLAPNGLGVRETAVVLLYAPLGVPPEQAFALGLAWSLTLFACGLTGGAVLATAMRPARAGLP